MACEVAHRPKLSDPAHDMLDCNQEVIAGFAAGQAGLGRRSNMAFHKSNHAGLATLCQMFIESLPSEFLFAGSAPC